MSRSRVLTVDIEIYDSNIIDEWPQGEYLVHGYDDVLWTDNLDDALSFLKQSIIEGKKNKDVSNENSNYNTDSFIPFKY